MLAFRELVPVRQQQCLSFVRTQALSICECHVHGLRKDKPRNWSRHEFLSDYTGQARTGRDANAEERWAVHVTQGNKSLGECLRSFDRVCQKEVVRRGRILDCNVQHAALLKEEGYDL